MQTGREMEAVFNRWVHEALRDRYAPALREPLPDVLLRLLDGADDRRSGAAADAVDGAPVRVRED